jgi:cyclic pyranopterin phosphate synthase
MPSEGVHTLMHDDIMRYEEIAAFVRTAARMGIKSVRITGGEPLVRKNVTDLIGQLSEIEGIEDLSLTTNAVLLERLAEPLARAGLKRINVSLDTLDPDLFARITRGGRLESTWRGIEAAEKAGLAPIKLNAVVIRGVNDGEMVRMARLTLEHDWDMRFIELMPVSNQAPWGPGFPIPEQAYVSIREMQQILAPLGLERIELANNGNGGTHAGSGPARIFHIPGALGNIGFISPLGEHFCQACNRLRLTADGCLRPCLLSDAEIKILPALRAGEDLSPYIEQAVGLKPKGHQLSRDPETPGQQPSAHPGTNGRSMREIGG